jgi:hypothetical protein
MGTSVDATGFHHEKHEAHEGRPGMPVFSLSFFVIFVFFVVVLRFRGSQSWRVPPRPRRDEEVAMRVAGLYEPVTDKRIGPG